MKKIFLLSLLGVFFLSAFCQLSDGTTEILTKISITKQIDDSELPPDFMPYSWNLYSYVIYDPFGGGVNCFGWGGRLCIPRFDKLYNSLYYRGMPTDAIVKTGETLVEESDALVAKGEYKGSLTKKIAYPDPQFGGKQSFILLQMNWDNDPKKPYNGKAEIIISKTDNFGLK